MNKLMTMAVITAGLSFSTSAVAAGEVNVNPAGLILGIADANMLFRVNDKIQLGPTLGYANMAVDTETKVSALSYGLRGELAQFGFVENGLYSAVQFDYAGVKIKDEVTTCDGPSMFAGKAAGGYAWRMSNRFHIKAGAGFTMMSFLEDTFSCDDGSQEVVSGLADQSLTGLALELSMGTSF